MRMTKKITSIVLAVMMVVSIMSVMAVTANAVGEYVAEEDYLTFTSQQDDSYVRIKNVLSGSGFQYNKNGDGWHGYNIYDRIDLNNGDYVRFRGSNTISDPNRGCFGISGKVAASGNIMSLRLDNESRSQGLTDECFSHMFEGCEGLITAPELPETTLAKECYDAMFIGCSNLTTAPELLATTLARSCYANMFKDCTSLTAAPELWATSLEYHCYASMFMGCTSLTELPELPATSLAEYCYHTMFYGCSSIRISEEAGTFNDVNYSVEYRIPAEDTARYALDSMFAGTGGEFKGTPSINTTYYVPAPAPKVAEVNGTQYKTLEEAIAAAPSGATVKLLADIDYSETYTVRNARDDGNAHCVDLKNLTLDLNGKTISAINGTVVFGGNGATIKNGTFALVPKDTDGSYKDGSYALFVDNVACGYPTSATVDVEDVVCNGAVNVSGATTELTNVTASTTPTKFYTVWAENGAKVTINSGTYTDAQTKGKGNLGVGSSDTESVINVEGGTFSATVRNVYKNTPAGAVKIAGGSFSKPVLEQYCADGYIPEDNGDGTYSVDGPYAAKVGNTGYAALQDALDVVPTGGTVTVLQDIATSGNIFADGYVSGGNRTYTVDLGGYTVSGGTFIVADGNDVTFKNGTIESAAYAIQNTATATVDSTATVKSTSSSVSAVYGAVGSTTNINGTVEGNKYGVIVKGGDLEVSGKVTATNSDGRAIALRESAEADINDGADVEGNYGVIIYTGSTVNVNGGEVKGVSHAISGNGTASDGPYTINVTGGSVTATNGAGIYNPNAQGTLNISGGTISGSTTAVAAGASSTNSISGGTFSSAVPEEYCADGFVPVANDDGTYGVVTETDILKDNVLIDGYQEKAVQGNAENGVRILTKINRDWLEANNAEYGYVVAKVQDKDMTANFSAMKKDGGNGEKTINCTGTYNNGIDGIDNTYVTLAVNGMSNNDQVAARFYVVVNGKTYYANYINTISYDGIIATYKAA